MADLIANIAKGAIAEKVRDGGNIQIVPFDAGATTDDALRDVDTLAAAIALGTERATGNWNRKAVANGSLTLTVDDTNNRVDIDMPDLLWSPGPTTGATTDLLIAEDNGGADTADAFLGLWDFPITPDGSEVQATINAAGWFRAS